MIPALRKKEQAFTRSSCLLHWSRGWCIKRPRRNNRWECSIYVPLNTECVSNESWGTFEKWLSRKTRICSWHCQQVNSIFWRASGFSTL